MHPPAPTTSQVRREITQDSLPSLPYNYTDYTEDTDKYYFNTKKNNTKREQSYDEQLQSQRSLSAASPLGFQSPLSSMSKEDSSSDGDGMDDIHLGNNKSIFRPRQDVHVSHTRKGNEDKSEHLPNLMTNSNVDSNVNCNEYDEHQTNIQPQVTNNSVNQSSDQSINSSQSNELARTFDLSNRNCRVEHPQFQLKRLPADTDYYKVFQIFGPAFEDFTHLLPGLRPFVKDASSSNNGALKLTPEELTIVKRRLKSAVFAFGGNITKSKVKALPSEGTSLEDFRVESYRKKLQDRFYQNEIRLSWDVEDDAPAEIVADVMGQGEYEELDLLFEDEKSRSVKEEDMVNAEQLSKHDKDKKRRKSDTPKTRYRCKRCGQPKQNHICPYKESMQRTIGTMSYPALNSFECTEPGKLAPSLSDMNNFFDNMEENPTEIQETSMTSRSEFNSMGNALHLIGCEKPDSGYIHPRREVEDETEHFVAMLKNKKRKISIQSSFVKSVKDEYSSDSLMRSSLELKPEQCREISVSSNSDSYGAYIYPTLPLAYLQRSSLCDSLYNLCKERFGLVEEASRVLDEAKISNTWDLAVAELIAQLLLILYCPVRDRTVEGLRKYLMLIGISC